MNYLITLRKNEQVFQFRLIGTFFKNTLSVMDALEMNFNSKEIISIEQLKPKQLLLNFPE